MAQASRPCKGCGALIYRTVAVAPIRHYCSPDCRPHCDIDGCEKPQHAKGMCTSHATRASRYGDPLAPKLRMSNVGACSVGDCEQPMRKVGFCASHYAMWREFGEIRDWHYRHGDGGYIPTHNWIRRQRGKPGQHSCVDCGCVAEEWSYDNADPDERRDPNHDNAAFSRKLEHYAPRCVPCHRAFDREARRKKRMMP